jgi:hypothetical protein
MPVRDKQSLSYKIGRWAPWIAGLVLVAGAVAFAIAYFGTTGKSAPQTLTGRAQLVKEPKQLKSVPPEVRVVAGKFIKTAVGREGVSSEQRRKNLDYAWTITGAELKGGMTLKEWRTGNIPVIPYPVGTVDTTLFKVDEAFQDEVLLSIAMIPKKGIKADPALFKIGLVKRHNRWVVNYWMTGESPSMPTAGGGGAGP